MEFRRAVPADLEALMRLQADFYREDGYVHRIAAARDAWTMLLGNERLGEAWLVDSTKPQAGAIGYVVVTFSFSLEFLGRDAFVDELFVEREWRGQGLGRKALVVAETICRNAGVRALHLEMEHGKQAAARLYRAWGFVDHRRALMTKWLDAPE